MRSLPGLVAVGLGAACATSVGAELITFSGLQHGEIVTTQFVTSNGLLVTAVNPNRAFDIAAIFDSLETGTADPDLEGPRWDAGNLAPGTVLGNLLILAENNTGAGDGILNNPDDEAERPAGSFIFDFDDVLTQFGFDIIDVEGTMQENGSIEFYLAGVHQGTVQFSDFVNNLSVHYDSTVEFGNHTANHINPILASTLGSAGFDRVILNLGGSGAIDNLSFEVPAPGAVVVLAAAAFGRRRRRA